MSEELKVIAVRIPSAMIALVLLCVAGGHRSVANEAPPVDKRMLSGGALTTAATDSTAYEQLSPTLSKEELELIAEGYGKAHQGA